MTSIDTTQTVAELARTHPGAARVFERLGIDYCCRGKQPLDLACREAHVPLEDATHLLSVAGLGRGAPHIPQDAHGLIELILDRHHVFTRDELARLVPLSAKVLRVHGARVPALVDVDRLVQALAEDLLPHMEKEERVLFPYIQQLEAGIADRPPFGTVQAPLRVMHAEHEQVGALLEALSDATNQYTPPSDACGSFCALYEGLRELQADVHEHVYLENHVLFPLAEQLERARG